MATWHDAKAAVVDEDPQAGLQISVCENGYRGFLHGVYLVRGCGKRSIRAIVRRFPAVTGGVDNLALAAVAARYASKRGWRKVVVAPDDMDRADARVFNLDQFLLKNLRCGHQGVSLVYLG